MEPKRRQRVELVVLAVLVVGAAAYYAWPEPPGGAPRPAAAPRGRAATPSAQQTAPSVHLEVLTAERPRPEGVSRDLFSFKSRVAPTPPPPPPPPVAVQRPVPVAPAVPAGPPPPPPIPLKFAALLGQGSVKIAVLIDSVGHAIYGKEGETVEGRYRILRISKESIDMSYVDGRGRQTIRMNGT